jgi:ABC-2 type transport system ATP-binding protein
MSVSVKNLTKIFGVQKALNDISFEVKAGEIVGFLGPNGAGKSTTMKIATGYLPPSMGTIEICGFDITKQTQDVRRSIGYLPEHNPLYLDMYVKEYLAFSGKLYGLRGQNLQNRIAEMIELCGLQREAHKKIVMLSKGYRQRVGLAQALLHNPPVLILDEPTTGLDPNQIVEIRQVIKNAATDKTIIFSTHIMQEVQAICDRAVVINLGEIVANQSVSELKNIKNEKILVVEFQNLIEKSILESLEGVLAVKELENHRYEIRTDAQTDLRSEVFKMAAEKNWVLLGLQQQEINLENIFRELTKS